MTWSVIWYLYKHTCFSTEQISLHFHFSSSPSFTSFIYIITFHRFATSLCTETQSVSNKIPLMAISKNIIHTGREVMDIFIFFCRLRPPGRRHYTIGQLNPALVGRVVSFSIIAQDVWSCCLAHRSDSSPTRAPGAQIRLLTYSSAWRTHPTPHLLERLAHRSDSSPTRAPG